MHRLLLLLLIGSGVGLAPPARAADVTAGGERLASAIDALDVEHHWPAGVHVNWKTGEPDGRPESGHGKHTHCSAFVAAAAQRVGVYILRPPEHPQRLLANAQYEWLSSDAGVAAGWKPVGTAMDAQSMANSGWLVLATYRNRRDDKPGHIAIVRPSNKSRAQVLEEGPQITQAGLENFRSTSLRIGFASHPAAWSHQEVRYYVHAVDQSDLAGLRGN